MTTLPLFPEDDPRAVAFAEFLVAQPDVFPLFCRLAREVRAAGHKRYSADAIVHRIRWHYTIELAQADFKINNWFRAPMARKLEREDVSFEGFFEYRGGGEFGEA